MGERDGCGYGGASVGRRTRIPGEAHVHEGERGEGGPSLTVLEIGAEHLRVNNNARSCGNRCGRRFNPLNASAGRAGLNQRRTALQKQFYRRVLSGSRKKAYFFQSNNGATTR